MKLYYAGLLGIACIEHAASASNLGSMAINSKATWEKSGRISCSFPVQVERIIRKNNICSNRGATMTGTSKKSLIRTATIIAFGLIAAFALSVPEDAKGESHVSDVRRGKAWGGDCRKEKGHRTPDLCCQTKGKICRISIQDTEWLNSCDISMSACRRVVRDSVLQAPIFGNPQDVPTDAYSLPGRQKVAPLPAPASPKPSQKAPQPGVIAPTPAQPLLNRPSKTAPQQKTIE
jgi:hypothetical protein